MYATLVLPVPMALRCLCARGGRRGGRARAVGTEEGWHVLFKGLGPACFEKVPSTAIGYYIYEGMKSAMRVASI